MVKEASLLDKSLLLLAHFTGNVCARCSRLNCSFLKLDRFHLKCSAARFPDWGLSKEEAGLSLSGRWTTIWGTPNSFRGGSVNGQRNTLSVGYMVEDLSNASFR